MFAKDSVSLVKERTDIVALVGETVRLTRRGRSFVGLCPFHKEKTPSFHVSPERGYFYCFGCKESGSAIDFMMKIEGRPFGEAVRALAERAGIVIEETWTDQEQKEAAAARRAKEDLYAVNALAATFFEQSLRGGNFVSQHPLSSYAVRELAKRGLSLEANVQEAHALQSFRIGYAPHGWDGLTQFLKRQGVSPLTAERVGLVIPRSSATGHYDRFRHRLMFSVMDVMGRVVAFSGRALEEPETSSSQESAASHEPPAKYMNSPESPIYTKGEHLFGLYQARQSLRQKSEAIVVEGNFDVVSLHARGFDNAIAPLGTAFTSEQAKLLKRFAPACTLLFDSDTAGRKAVVASRKPCREGGLVVKVASLPEGNDPDDFVRQRGTEALTRLLQNAKGLLEHLMDQALHEQHFGSGSMTEQLARIKNVVALLTEENDPTLRAMAKTYADRLAATLIVQGRPVSDLRQLEQTLVRALHSTEVVSEHASAAPIQVDRIHLRILGALIDFPDLLLDADCQDSLLHVEGDVALTIAQLRNYFRTEQKSAINMSEFLAQIPRSIHSFAAGRFASPEFEDLSDAKLELLENARKLNRLGLLRENAAQKSELERAQAEGDVDTELTLLRNIERRSREKLGLKH